MFKGVNIGGSFGEPGCQRSCLALLPTAFALPLGGGWESLDAARGGGEKNGTEREVR